MVTSKLGKLDFDQATGRGRGEEEGEGSREAYE